MRAPTGPTHTTRIDSNFTLACTEGKIKHLIASTLEKYQIQVLDEVLTSLGLTGRYYLSGQGKIRLAGGNSIVRRSSRAGFEN